MKHPLRASYAIFATLSILLVGCGEDLPGPLECSLPGGPCATLRDCCLDYSSDPPNAVHDVSECIADVCCHVYFEGGGFCPPAQYRKCRYCGPLFDVVCGECS